MIRVAPIASLLFTAAILTGGATDASADGAAAPDNPTAEAAARHWSFRPPVRPQLTGSISSKPTRNPVDVLLQKRQAALGIKPGPEADRRTQIRRLTFDLTGLPPSSADVERFVADDSSGAYARLVERLLASPRYGERWGRFWLDLARWAESDGFEANALRSSAWRYRDYVVQAFNTDKPYDQFLREQIAGDELTPYSDEHLIATGFLAAGRSNNNEEDKLAQLNGPRVDMANTVASVTLGLTMNCAQCHDHKFEPLTTQDYYALQAFFARGQINELVLQDPALVEQWERGLPPELGTARTLLAELAAPIRRRLTNGAAPGEAKVTDERVRQALNEDDRKLFDALKKKIQTLEDNQLKRKPSTWGFYSPATSPHVIENLPPRGQYPFPYQPAVLKTNQTFVLLRGDPHQPGPRVSPGLPAVLDPTATNFTSRTQLVDWLISDTNPLTARVWVNLVWQQHFGRGLVDPPGDFGLKGAPPANQELLDWLACELKHPAVIAGGESELARPWSTKHLQRLLVASAAYQRAGRHDDAKARRDPDDRTLWRWEPRRLESEALRDAMLAVSGLLDDTAGGPSQSPTNGPSTRRSLYLRQQRNLLPAMQARFDAPNGNESCPRRHVSTVALQPLHLLNNADVYRWAEAFAARVLREAGEDLDHQIDRACQLALNRLPDPTERQWAATFLTTARPTEAAPAGKERAPTGTASATATDPGATKPSLALVHFCHALLNLNEFAYLQ